MLWALFIYYHLLITQNILSIKNKNHIAHYISYYFNKNVFFLLQSAIRKRKKYWINK